MVYPDVSIIVPHLNQNDALMQCILSLEKQDYPLDKLELIIVDNGSKIIPALKNRVFKGLIVLSEVTPGPGPARNTGVAASSGAILFFIDADCTADPNWIMSGVLCLEKGEAPLIGGDVRIPIADNNRVTALEAYEMIFAYQQETYIKKEGFSGSGNLATRRAVFDEVGPFPGIEVAEDTEWGKRALSLGFSFSYCPNMIVFHPARKTFAEIFQKWARHSKHVYATQKEMPLLRWAFRSLLVLASIPVHSIKVITSNRLHGVMPKVKAITALATIRLFRVGYMLRMIFSKKFRNRDVSWNQD